MLLLFFIFSIFLYTTLYERKHNCYETIENAEKRIDSIYKEVDDREINIIKYKDTIYVKVKESIIVSDSDAIIMLRKLAGENW